MKKLIISFLILGLGVNAFAQNDSINQIDKKGYKQGKWVKKYRSGKVYYQGEFKDNMEIGEFLFFYPDGQVQIRNMFFNEGSVCYSETFYESGKLLAKGKYLNKQKDSIWNYYSERTQKITVIESYKKGEREGGSYTISERGDTAESTIWKNNMKNGAWFKMYEDGYLESSYKDSKLEGLYSDFYKDGKLKEKGYFQEGKRVGGWDLYTENGKKIKFESWRDGEMKERILYYDEGETVIPVPIDEIAYFYKDMDKTVVVTNQNEKYLFTSDFNTIHTLVGSDLFVLVNYEKGIAVQQKAIQKAIYGSKNKILSIEVEPASEIQFAPDEEGEKSLQSFFREGLEE